MGHSENYSFDLELETAIAQAADQSSRFLSNQIVRNPGSNRVSHSEFDNFDQLINDVSSGGSIHTAHGIMLQETTGEIEVTSDDTPVLERCGQRSLHLDDVTLPDCYLTVRKDPQLIVVKLSYAEGPPAMSMSRQRQMLWFLRSVLYQNQQISLGS